MPIAPRSVPRFIILLLCAAGMALTAMAQPAPAPPPPPLPATPPPLPAAAPPAQTDVGGDPELEPQVTIIRNENETLEEVRVNGELRYVKVTPRNGGRPYFLIPSGNGTTFIRRDSLDFGLRPPMWLLFSW